MGAVTESLAREKRVETEKRRGGEGRENSSKNCPVLMRRNGWECSSVRHFDVRNVLYLHKTSDALNEAESDTFDVPMCA